MRWVSSRMIFSNSRSNWANGDIMHDVRVRACNRAAALHGSRFAPMCSALIFRHRPYNSKAMTSWKAAFKSYAMFDSTTGHSDVAELLPNCQMIVCNSPESARGQCPTRSSRT